MLAARTQPRRPPKADAARSPTSRPNSRPQARDEVAGPAPDLRDLLDIRLADDDPRIPNRFAVVADAAALLRDDPPADRRKQALAEARREARRCPSCGSVVLSGMSLCERCGIDLDTGQRYDIDEDCLHDVPTPPIAMSGPPATVLVIGVIALVTGLALAVLSVFMLGGVGALLLTPVCLFGAFAGLQFLRGKALKLMIVSLMLGGGVDLVALVILPIWQADAQSIPDQGADSEPAAKPEPADAEGIQVKPLTERIDGTKLAVGIAIFLMDAAMLIAIATPGVHHYFERRRQSLDEGYIIP